MAGIVVISERTPKSLGIVYKKKGETGRYKIAITKGVTLNAMVVKPNGEALFAKLPDEYIDTILGSRVTDKIVEELINRVNRNCLHKTKFKQK